MAKVIGIVVDKITDDTIKGHYAVLKEGVKLDELLRIQLANEIKCIYFILDQETKVFEILSSTWVDPYTRKDACTLTKALKDIGYAGKGFFVDYKGEKIPIN